MSHLQPLSSFEIDKQVTERLVYYTKLGNTLAIKRLRSAIYDKASAWRLADHPEATMKDLNNIEVLVNHAHTFATWMDISMKFTHNDPFLRDLMTIILSEN